MQVMTPGILLLTGGLVFLCGSALGAVYWALRSGQFEDLKSAAATIFDDGEPVGLATDKFPSSK
jgi:cbb3-type cytochrome oxidase maturation protein